MRWSSKHTLGPQYIEDYTSKNQFRKPDARALVLHLQTLSRSAGEICTFSSYHAEIFEKMHKRIISLSNKLLDLPQLHLFYQIPPFVDFRKILIF